jgi:hypothetical protein
MTNRVGMQAALSACFLIVTSASLAGCKNSDAPQTLADQKTAVTGAPAPPGAIKAIADAQAQQAANAKNMQAAMQASHAAARAKAAAAAPK